MNRPADFSLQAADQVVDTRFSNDRLLLVLDRFAESMDRRIQETLVTELMARYTEVSAWLEETNRRLRESDAARLEAQRVARLGSWNIDLTDGAITWSETMFELLELPETPRVEMEAFFSRVDPQDHMRVRQAIADAGRGAALDDISYRLLMPDGRMKWVLSRHVYIPASPGVTPSMHGTLQDVTDAKLSEEKLQHYNDHLEEVIREKTDEVLASQIATLHALVKLSESRDDETGEHVARTSSYCGKLAVMLREGSPYSGQIDDAFIQNITLASPLHDIGKVGIPDRILLKPGRLTPEEFAVMQTHVTIGYQTLASVEKQYPGNSFLRTGMEIALNHHEKWDGSGYRHALKGTDIPLSARIMALSDVYDALRSRRVYKEPYTHEESMGMILEGRGRHFDPVLVDVLAPRAEEFRQIFDKSAHSRA